MAACSDRTKIDQSSFYRKLEPRLAITQKAGKKRRLKVIHRTIANRRKDKNHKVSTTITHTCGLIVVENVSSSKLGKTHSQVAVGRGMVRLERNAQL